jgi:hypothetical protein
VNRLPLRYLARHDLFQKTSFYPEPRPGDASGACLNAPNHIEMAAAAAMGAGTKPQENLLREHFLIWIKDRTAFAYSMFGGWSCLAGLILQIVF